MCQGAGSPQSLALSSAHLFLPSSAEAGRVAQLSFVLAFLSLDGADNEVLLRAEQRCT